MADETESVRTSTKTEYSPADHAFSLRRLARVLLPAKNLYVVIMTDDVAPKIGFGLTLAQPAAPV